VESQVGTSTSFFWDMKTSVFGVKGL